MTDVSRRPKKREKIVNDIVHGTINLPTYILEIVDTPQFQRLRWVTQMGFELFVFPTCSGTRFEHSIGTFHLASKLLKKIKFQIENEHLKDKGLVVSENEIRCVEIAALCHDLGHGPYSHTWEHEIVPLLPSNKRKYHEHLSYEILLDILQTIPVIKDDEETTIQKIINLDDKDLDLIRRIILGEYQKENDKGKKLLFQIVANKESGLDLDKFDYLCRDTIHLGWSNKNKIQDISRIIHYYRVIKNENNEWCLALRDNEILNIHEIFYFRHILHRYACQHKIVKSIHCMFKDSMKKIIETKSFLKDLVDNVLDTESDDSFYIPEVLQNKDFISKCCDYHIWTSMNKHTRDITNNIINRRFYRFYSSMKIDEKSGMDNPKLKPCSKEACVNELEKEFNTILNQAEIENPMKISVSAFSLGNMFIEDPISKIPFYRKDQKEKCFTYDEKNERPELPTLIFKEYIIMVFTEHEVRTDKERNLLDNAVEELSGADDVYCKNERFSNLRKCYVFTKFVL